MKKEKYDYTKEWQQYEDGITYKNSIGLYKTINENYRYVQGDQWGNTDSNGLPTPVFNIIRPILNYKIAQLFDKSAKIMFQSTNRKSQYFENLVEVADKLTDYADELWEQLKMDKNLEDTVLDGAITGNGIVYFYYGTNKNEVAYEQIDITNVYPADPNQECIKDQEYIIIAFRRPTKEVRKEATLWRKAKKNKLTDYDIDGIGDDTDNQYEAGDNAQIEIDNYGKTTVLLKLWKENGTVHFRKSTKSCVIVENEDTGLVNYPIAKFDWIPKKNSFYSVSDVSGIIPNQDYINTMAAMIMASTTFTAFPKMVYNADFIDNPSNDVGVAIAVDGSGDTNIKSVIDYITPGEISNAAFQMFQQTMDVTKELMGANDSALGNVNPDQASGKAIIAVMEQSQVPLERIRRRYFDFVEDIALIWADMWRVYTENTKDIIANDEDGNKQLYTVTKEAFCDIMLKIKIDVGTSNRWSAIATLESLQNLLQAQYIDFNEFIELIPENSGLPVKKLKELMQKRADAQFEQEQMAQNIDSEAEMMAQESMPNIDELMNNLTPEQEEQFRNNPQMLQDFIKGQVNP